MASGSPDAGSVDPISCVATQPMSIRMYRGVRSRGLTTRLRRAPIAVAIRPSVMYTVAAMKGGAARMRRFCWIQGPALSGVSEDSARP